MFETRGWGEGPRLSCDTLVLFLDLQYNSGCLTLIKEENDALMNKIQQIILH